MSIQRSLGKLDRVQARDVFTHEALDFTPWLAQEENLALLGEAVGLSLILEAQEQPVGLFRADLLCKDADTEQWVLIENQLDRTDHSHLGQIITYASGLQAATIIWIAGKFTEEHRAALDWLNASTIQEVQFFGVEIECWQIGLSDVAPKFNIVSAPNQWRREVSRAISKTGAATPGFRDLVFAYIREQVQQGKTPTVQEIMENTGCGQRTAFKYKKEALAAMQAK